MKPQSFKRTDNKGNTDYFSHEKIKKSSKRKYETLSPEHLNKNPIHRNEPFVCKNCKESNPKAAKGCRNHCRNCLYSLHVDENVPGDRLSECLGLMEPIDIEQSQKKGFKILHRCKNCGKMMWNMVAEDDDLYLITQLIKFHNERTKKIENSGRKKTEKQSYSRKKGHKKHKR